MIAEQVSSHGRSEAARGLAVLLAVLACGCGGPKSEHPELAQVTADRAAAEAAALAGAGGDAVLVRFADEPAAEAAFPKRFRDAFTRSAAKAGLKIRADEIVPPNPAAERTGEPVSREAFLGVLRKHADAKLVVSTVSVPAISARDLEALGPRRPKLLLVSDYPIPYHASLPPGLVSEAIVPWNAIPGLDGAPPENAGLFDRYFRIVRPGR